MTAETPDPNVKVRMPEKPEPPSTPPTAAGDKIPMTSEARAELDQRLVDEEAALRQEAEEIIEKAVVWSEAQWRNTTNTSN